jgi:hypothetical protein
MTDVAPGVITFGLGCDQTGLVIGNIFNLGFIKVIVGGSPIIPPVEPPQPGVSGGSRPLAPGEIHNFYKPVDNQYQVPYIQNQPKIPVVIKITFRGKTTEKYYLVSKKRSDIIITVLNLVNRIRDRISIVVKNVRSAPNRIVAFVRNLRKSDED